MKYSSATLVDGIVTLSLSRSASISVLDRFLTNNTQIQLKIFCHESSNDIKKTQSQIKVEIRGRIGRIVGCLPLQSDASVATNQLTSNDSRDAQNLLQTFYDNLWKQMEQKTFTMQQVNCENSIELNVDEYSNIKGPEKAAEFLKQGHEQMTTNQ
ncbi:unnamed protein product, partial [Rotaria sp. Silwood1]